MRSLKSYILSLLVGIVALGVASSPALAVTLDVRGGQLHGATGVDVGGSLFDVQFVDGSCAGLFGGCTNPVTDFTFTTYETANLARIALSEQVFIDTAAGNFDSNPSLTNGLSSDGYILTPYTHGRIDGYIAAVTFFNAIVEATDRVTSTYLIPGTQNTGFYGDRTYAVWSVSVVPLPAALPLYGAGIAVLGFIGWRRKQRQITA